MCNWGRGGSNVQTYDAISIVVHLGRSGGSSERSEEHTDCLLQLSRRKTAPASSYEMGEHMPLLPAYARGQAYLLAGDGAKAAVEFQKLMDHRGLIQNSVSGALARLGVARAYAMLSRSAQSAGVQDAARAKARFVYSDFLRLWQNADPEIPVLRQAKLEYLQLTH